MSKIILSFLVLAIVSQTLCKEYYQCDSAGKYSCSVEQTCCRNKVSSTGWACFPAKKGVCCSDGISCCPANNVCNLREKRCDPQSVTFLSELSNEELGVDTFLEANMNAVKESALDFAYGFLDGFTFFKGLPHEKECKIDDPRIAQDFIDIANLVKEIKITTNFKRLVEDVLALGRDIIERIKNLSGSCKPYGDEVSKVLESLASHVTRFVYYPNLALHTATNIGEITKKVKTATSAFSQDQFKEAGFAFGDLTKFIIFWDFKTPEVKAFLQEIDNIGDASEVLNFVLGLQEGFTFFKGLPHQDECKPNDPQLTQDVLDVVNLVKNVTWSTDFSKLVTEVLAKANDIYTRLGKISGGCTAFSLEVKKVVDALAAHVTKSGYTNTLLFHTIGNMENISTKAKTGTNYLTNKKFFEAGTTFGDLVKFVLFWDFKQN